jgi:hypothetical protein
MRAKTVSQNPKYLGMVILLAITLKEMIMFKIFLDTCTIIGLSGLDEIGFDRLRRKLEETKSELHACHIQVDESLLGNFGITARPFKEAFRKFGEHQIKIQWEEPTRGAVIGVSRIGLCTVFGEDLSKIYRKLVSALSECMRKSGKYKNKADDGEKEMLNNARDALTALTSTTYDFFITSDKCLYKSWKAILQENETRRILGQTLNPIYVRPSAEKILNSILAILSNPSSSAS